MQKYERKFAEIPDDKNLSKLCSDAGFFQEIKKRQFFITIDDDTLDSLKGSCREYTSTSKSQNIPTERVDSLMKMGPVLDVKIYPHEGRYCIDIKIESFFKDQTVSWVRIVNEVKKYVTETSEEIPIENVQLFTSTKRFVAKAKPRPTLIVNLSPNYVPIRGRKWIVINPAKFSQSCVALSKFMIRLLRHDKNILREDDGAVRSDDLIEEFEVKFAGLCNGQLRIREETLSILLVSLLVQ